ncbi:MAG: beta-ketoacyl-ACP synthase II [Tidjanibacter sp.]|nr:beta-ketoacyl-ACP synthase II [Tidjanibacter sp.]
MTNKRVVVTGLGTINPLGKSVGEFFSNLKAGVSGAGPITAFDASKFKTRIACEIKDYKWEEYFNPKEVKKHDLFEQYSLIATNEAVLDSGIEFEKEDKKRIGVIWGVGIGGLHTFQDEISAFALGDGTPRFSPFLLVRLLTNMASGQISLKYGLMGPNYDVTSACSSSSSAIINAVDQIRLGRADVVITGGSEAAINESGVGSFNAMMALSTRNDDPKTASRPYDANRDGFVMGEGAGALIIEEYEHAVARGAKIYAEIVGCGLSADAYHVTASHPEGDGALLSMQGALNEAGIKASQLDYINTHGTSTPTGDVPELKAIMRLLGEDVYKVNISSTKSMTGHLLGAAGAVESLATIMAIKDGIIPPTINNSELDPAIDPNLNLTLNRAQEREVKYALSNTFGFGGQNATLIFGKVQK